MGVSGGGKSTIGTLLAHRLGWPFLDADDLHPADNVAKMQRGVPLTDSDRWPWLDGEALVEMVLWDTSRHYEAHLAHLAPLAYTDGR